MKTISLVNNDLDRRAHYISRITALKNSNGRVCLKLNIMLTEWVNHH